MGNQNTKIVDPAGEDWDEISRTESACQFFDAMEQQETDLPNRGLSLPATEEEEVKE